MLRRVKDPSGTVEAFARHFSSLSVSLASCSSCSSFQAEPRHFDRDRWDGRHGRDRRANFASVRWRQLGWTTWTAGLSSASSGMPGARGVADERNGLVADTLPYKLSVVTGDVRGAGSSTPVVVTLYGDGDSNSESHVIGGEENQAFERATKSQYVLYSKSLGRLRRIVIEQLPEKRGRSAEDTAWYLDRIEVQCPDGHRYAFPCSSWFGKDGKKKNLMVADEHRDTQRSSLHDPSPADRLTQPLHVAASGLAIPHPSKVRLGIKGVNRKGGGHGGEDSYFYASNSNGSFAVGVADGVYEWKLSGIDAGMSCFESLLIVRRLAHSRARLPTM